MAPLAGPSADRSCHLRCLPARAPKPVCGLGRCCEFPRQPSLSGARLEPAPLDVDHAPGPLHSADVDDARAGLPAVGHEPLRVSPDESPPAHRECGRLLLRSPSDPDTGSAQSLRTRSRARCIGGAFPPPSPDPSPSLGELSVGVTAARSAFSAPLSLVAPPV